MTRAEKRFKDQMDGVIKKSRGKLKAHPEKSRGDTVICVTGKIRTFAWFPRGGMGKINRSRIA